MGEFFRNGSQGTFLAVGLALACLAAGCTSDGTSPATMSLAPGAPASAAAEAINGDPQAVPYEDNALYAGRSTYRCDNGENIEVDNTVTHVALGLSDGTVMELPASPADSHTRYVKDQYAFVFDGTEALYFRPKAPPATCRR